MIATLSADQRVIIILSVLCIITGTAILIWWRADQRRLRKGLEEDAWLDRR